jgi:dsRNA-specific ribonuclease
MENRKREFNSSERAEDLKNNLENNTGILFKDEELVLGLFNALFTSDSLSPEIKDYFHKLAWLGDSVLSMEMFANLIDTHKDLSTDEIIGIVNLMIGNYYLHNVWKNLKVGKPKDLKEQNIFKKDEKFFYASLFEFVSGLYLVAGDLDTAKKFVQVTLLGGGEKIWDVWGKIQDKYKTNYKNPEREFQLLGKEFFKFVVREYIIKFFPHLSRGRMEALTSTLTSTHVFKRQFDSFDEIRTLEDFLEIHDEIEFRHLPVSISDLEIKLGRMCMEKKYKEAKDFIYKNVFRSKENVENIYSEHRRVS